MKNELMTSLISAAEKLKNTYSDESLLEEVMCRLNKELAVLANVWNCDAAEALLLAAIIIRTTDRIFEPCTFSHISKVLGISNLELIRHFHLLQNLIARGFIRTEELQNDELSVIKPGGIGTAVKPKIPELGSNYQLSEATAAQLFS